MFLETLAKLDICFFALDFKQTIFIVFSHFKCFGETSMQHLGMLCILLGPLPVSASSDILHKTLQNVHKIEQTANKIA